MSSDLERRLSQLFSRELPQVDAARVDVLEQRLLARGCVSAPPGTVLGWLALHRFAVAVVVAALLVAGACRLPAEYPIDVGERVAILVDGSRRALVDPQAIAEHVEHAWPLERLEVAVALEREDSGDETMRIQLTAVGDVTADEMWEDLVETFPALDGARMEPEDLQAVVHGTLGGRLSHDLLDLELVIDEADAERAREQILADLAARGVEGDAQVTVTDHPDGRREVRVEVQAEHER
jgi:hypothetical protein